MREPYLFNEVGEQVPFSAVPSEVLRAFDVLPRLPGLRERDHDEDFRRSYAAILLQERGA